MGIAPKKGLYILLVFILILAGCVNSVVQFQSNGRASSKMCVPRDDCRSFQMCVSIDDSGSFQMYKCCPNSPPLPALASLLSLALASVTRFGNLSPFWQFLEAFGDNLFAKNCHFIKALM